MECIKGLTLKKACSNDTKHIVSLYKQFRPDWEPVYNLSNRIVHYPAIVAYKDNDLIGFAYCFYFAPQVLELANIYVAENNRSNGIGTGLLETLENSITHSKYEGLILSNSNDYKTEQIKHSASKFYLDNGYNEIASTSDTKVFYKNFRNRT